MQDALNEHYTKRCRGTSVIVSKRDGANSCESCLGSGVVSLATMQIISRINNRTALNLSEYDFVKVYYDTFMDGIDALNKKEAKARKEINKLLNIMKQEEYGYTLTYTGGFNELVNI